MDAVENPPSYASLRLMLEALEREVVLANMFQDVPIGVQLKTHLRSPRPQIALGVLEREVDLQRFIVYPMDALGDVHLIAVRVAHAVQPRLAVQTDRIHDQ